MPELDLQASAEVTARLLEELHETKERLQRLEAALAERSLLPGIQQEPDSSKAGQAGPISATSPRGAPANGDQSNGNGDRGQEADAHFRRGVSLCQGGNYDAALAAWEEVLRIQPGNPYALANVGIVLTEQGRWAEARDLFVRVIEVQPDNAEAHYGLGMADAQLGNYAGAIAAWENTIRLQPDNTDVHYNMALVRQRLGQQIDARDRGKVATAASPSNSTAGTASAGTAIVPDEQSAVPQPESDAREPARQNAEEAVVALSSAPNPPADASAASSSDEPPAAQDETVGMARDNADAKYAEEPPAGGPGAADRTEESLVSDDTVEPFETYQPRLQGQPIDWKRVEGPSETGKRGSQAKRGVGFNRTSTRRSSLAPIGLFIASGLVLAGAYAVIQGQRNKALASASIGKAPALSNQTTPALPEKAPDTQPSAAKAAPTTVVPAVLADPELDPAAAEGASGPAAPGNMRVRLGAGVAGQFRYWFVYGTTPAARMHSLPRPSRSGAIILWIPPAYNRPGAQLRILDVKQGKVARIPILDALKPARAVSPNVGANLLLNADFSQGAKGWSLENTAPARGSMRIEDGLSGAPGVTGRTVHFEVAAIGKQSWNVQCYQMGVNLKDGEKYLLSFWAKSDRPRSIRIDGIMDKPDWHPIGLGASPKFGASWEKYLIPFTATRSEPSHTRVSFVLGEVVGPVDISGIALRRREGAPKSVALPPDATVTVTARDFN